MSNIYYVQTNVMCILLLIGVDVLTCSRKTIVPAQRLAFRQLVLSAIVLSVSDVFAWLCTGKMFPGAGAVVELSNMAYFASISWACFAWLYYVNIHIKGFDFNQKHWLRIYAAPFVFVLAVILINPLTHFLFSVDEQNVYARGNGVILHWVISWGYLIVATVQIAAEMRRTKSRSGRKRLAAMLRFIVLPALAAIYQMLFYGVTAMQTGITLSIIIIAFEYLDDQVSNDALTGLNNRRALESYISDQVQKQNGPFTVLMCDIDKFKTINDTFGHAVGDLALKSMGTVLKKACGKTELPLFLCRYGGDEFVLCGVNISEDDIQKLTDCICGELQELDIRQLDGQKLNISIGSATGDCASESDVDALFREADSRMYEVKKEKV